MAMRMLIAATLLLLAAGCRDDEPSRVDQANQIAITYAAKEDATIRSATATWSPGTVANPNTDETCGSGQLVRITLDGSFPHIVTSGGPPGGDGTTGEVTGVFLTADAVSGAICLISVTTGEVVTGANATVLPMSTN